MAADGGPEGRKGLPVLNAETPELPLKQTRDALTCLPATNDTSEARDTTVRQKRPSMRGQTRQVPVASCWWECGMAPSHHKAGWQFLIKVNVCLPCDTATHDRCYLPKRNENLRPHKDLQTDQQPVAPNWK